MRRLLAALALLPAVPSPPEPRSCKAVAPIELRAAVEGDPAVSCRIRATSSAGARDVELEIVLPEGVSTLSGERKRTGRGAALDLEVRCAAPCDVLVRASLREGDAVLTRVQPLRLGAPPPPSPAGTLRTGARGEPILEFGP